jgi:hypothetical protein
MNSANFSCIDFSELPHRPSEELVHSPDTLHPVREYAPDVTNKAGGSKALLSLQEGEEQMIRTVASSRVMWVGRLSS